MAETVENNKSENRFQTEVDGFLAFIDYALNETTITLIHTEVPAELGGKGLGGKVVKAALDYARDQGLKVIPQCPFVAHYIEKHKEYEVLVEK